MSPERMRVHCLVWLLLWCLPAAGFALDQERLVQEVEAAQQRLEVPGLRAAVRFPDGRILSAAAGLADVETRTPLTDSIGMPGGSTGKTFVAAVAMSLVEDGTWAGADPASKWLGHYAWFKRLPNAADLRIEHLVTHTAGLVDHVDLTGFQLAVAWRIWRHGMASFEREELVGYALDRKPLFEPGLGYAYTDTGYILLGLAIEAAARTPYYDLLRTRILEPLALDRVRPADRPDLPDVATGYVEGTLLNRIGRIAGPTLDEQGVFKLDPAGEWTGGGLITTPRMLVRFYAALDSGDVVAPASFEIMLASGFKGGEQGHYGWGLYVSPDATQFGHGGWYPGYETLVRHHRTLGVTVAVQVNSDGGQDLGSVVGTLLQLATPRP